MSIGGAAAEQVGPIKMHIKQCLVHLDKGLDPKLFDSGIQETEGNGKQFNLAT